MVRVASGGLSLDTEYVLSFWVRNPSNATAGANVSIVASIPSTAADAGGVVTLNPQP